MSSFNPRCSRSKLLVHVRFESLQRLPIYTATTPVCLHLLQAISRFFHLYTLSINEWTFLAPAKVDPVHQSPQTRAYGFFTRLPFPTHSCCR